MVEMKAVRYSMVLLTSKAELRAWQMAGQTGLGANLAHSTVALKAVIEI